MTDEELNSLALPRRRGLLRRLTKRATPVVVWIAALAAAIHLYQGRNTVGTLVGHTELRSVTLSDLEPGVVRNVYVQLHETVSASQTLVAIDDSRERIAFAAVRSDIERLTAEVTAERARLVAENARASVDAEDLGRRFLVDRETTHLEYLSELMQDATDRVLLRGALVDYEFVHRLLDGTDATIQEWNDEQTRVDALKAKVAGNESTVARAKAAFEDADRRWSSFSEHEDVATSYDAVLTPMRLAVDVRQRDLEELVRRIDARVLRAPFAGQVTVIYAEPGDRVQAGDPLLTIAATSSNRVVAYLPERSTFAVRQGTPVSVQRLGTGLGPASLHTGVVASLSAVVDEVPVRNRTIATVPSWGRSMVVALDGPANFVPGEAVRISLPGVQ